ncbi:MAG: hypothetical protein V3T17_15725 [Pseudomonadales bacterium]
MDMGNDYLIAWSLYLLAVVAAQILTWRILRPFLQADIRAIVQLCVFSILITPARLEAGASYWVPAFVAALMDGVNDGVDAAIVRLWPIVMVMLVLVSISLVWKLRKSLIKTNSQVAS